MLIAISTERSVWRSLWTSQNPSSPWVPPKGQNYSAATRCFGGTGFALLFPSHSLSKLSLFPAFFIQWKPCYASEVPCARTPRHCAGAKPPCSHGNLQRVRGAGRAALKAPAISPVARWSPWNYKYLEEAAASCSLKETLLPISVQFCKRINAVSELYDCFFFFFPMIFFLPHENDCLGLKVIRQSLDCAAV